MRAIEISEEVYQKLQAIAVPFQDTPCTVIERLLSQTNGAGRRAPSAAPATVAAAETPSSDDGIYTYKRPTSFTFDGHSHSVSTFKELYLELCRELASRHPESFDRVLGLRGRERCYFATSNSEMTHPRRIEGTNVFAETNFSAQNIMDQARELVRLFGYDAASLTVTTRPVAG